MKCDNPFHPEYNGQECLCVDCLAIYHCIENPCSLCDGPVKECDYPLMEEENGRGEK